MKIRFRRITTSGEFIPQIDGLRFIAVMSVVIYHLTGFIMAKDVSLYNDNTNYSILKRFLKHGDLGIPLFFIISGFVLGLPFARQYTQNGERVKLGKYFIRRLTRLEPPYILVMTALLVGAVYVAKIVTLQEGLSSYFSSIIYSHNLIYDVLPILNGSAWSLEVEIQFYVLAPLVAAVFLSRSLFTRRSGIVLAILFFFVFNYMFHMPFRSFINFFQYFLMGLLLADLYVSRHRILPETKFDSLIAVFLFVVIWFFDKKDFPEGSTRAMIAINQFFCIFLFHYYVIFHKGIKFLSLPLITNIGGMCYSIYLLHYPIISLFGNPLLKYSFSDKTYINITVYVILLVFAVLIFSALFFLLVERPCMEKDWYKKIFSNKRKEKNSFSEKQ